MLLGWTSLWGLGHSLATLEVVKGIRLDVAVLEKATVLGASEQQLGGLGIFLCHGLGPEAAGGGDESVRNHHRERQGGRVAGDAARLRL